MTTRKKMKILILDNYDSFTYNLVHYLEELHCDVTVKRNDQFDLDELETFDYIVLSPGPGIPEESGLLKAAIERYAPTKNILGVCLGQQAIAEVFGAKLINLDKVYHGVATPINVVKDDVLFTDLPKTFEATRYHSLIIDKKSVSESLKITAETDDGLIMGVQHKEYNIHGVQF